QVQVLRQLLRDGAAASDGFAGLEVLLDRFLQLLDVHAVVSPEGVVFCHEDGLAQAWRDGLVADPPLHATGRLAVRHGLVVPQLDERGRGWVLRRERSNVWKRDEDVGEKREAGGREADGNLGGTTPHGGDYTRPSRRRIASDRPVYPSTTAPRD